MSDTKEALLPAEFADLERFSDWILATEPERYANGWPRPWRRCRISTTRAPLASKR